MSVHWGIDFAPQAHEVDAVAVVRHLFEEHADGRWRSARKDRYARLLLAEIDADPGLEARLLASGDRLTKMLTYRALELRRARRASRRPRRD